MKFKPFLALAGAAFALPAMAAIAPASSGDGELFLAVYDTTNKVSYTLDLNLQAEVKLKRSGGATTVASFDNLSEFLALDGKLRRELPGKMNFVISVDDENFSSFMSQANWETTRWAVMAADSTGAPTLTGSQRLLTTVQAGTTEATMRTTPNQKLTDGLGVAQMGNFYNAVNITGTHGAAGSALDFSVDGSSVNLEADAGRSYFGEAGGTSATLNSNLRFSAGNAVGASSSFYYVTQSGASPLGAIALNQMDNKWGAATWTFAAATGAESLASSGYSLTYAAAVPEPGTYALMALGLAAVGFVARRRKA